MLSALRLFGHANLILKRIIQLPCHQQRILLVSHGKLESLFHMRNKCIFIKREGLSLSYSALSLISKIQIQHQGRLCKAHHKTQTGRQEILRALPRRYRLQSLWPRRPFSGFSHVAASGCVPLNRLDRTGFIKLPTVTISSMLNLF